MSRPSLDNRVFVPVENTENGVISGNTRFHFWQEGVVFFADYFGGDVREGHIIGQFDETGRGHMLYHCLTTERDLKAGKAVAVFTKLEDGRMAMDLDWEWISPSVTSDEENSDNVKTEFNLKGQSRYEELSERELMK